MFWLTFRMTFFDFLVDVLVLVCKSTHLSFPAALFLKIKHINVDELADMCLLFFSCGSMRRIPTEGLPQANFFY